jgi:hypothetical protein
MKIFIPNLVFVKLVYKYDRADCDWPYNEVSVISYLRASRSAENIPFHVFSTVMTIDSPFWI